MNLIYAEVTELFTENGMQMGRVRVAGALKRVPLDLLTGVQCGDRVLLCDGVAVSKVIDTAADEKRYVSGDSR
jgi:hydrogenase maturation factor